MSYSLWKGIVVDIINILSTFSWNFVDLFLILISIALAEQFRQLNSRLFSIRGKVKEEHAVIRRRGLLSVISRMLRRCRNGGGPKPGTTTIIWPL
jgi:gustatory receptor